jgi:hypothetical protein
MNVLVQIADKMRLKKQTNKHADTTVDGRGL